MIMPPWINGKTPMKQVTLKKKRGENSLRRRSVGESNEKQRNDVVNALETVLSLEVPQCPSNLAFPWGY